MHPSRGGGLLWGLAGFALVALVGLGWWRQNQVMHQAVVRIQMEISASGSASAAAVGQWVVQRRGEAGLLAAFAVPGLSDSGPAGQAFLDHAVTTMAAGRGHSGIWLFGANGEVLAEAPGSMPVEAGFVELALSTVVTGDPQIAAPVRGPGSGALISVSHPVVTPGDSGVLRGMGAVVLVDDLSKALQAGEGLAAARDSAARSAIIGAGGDGVVVLDEFGARPARWFPADSIPAAFGVGTDSAAFTRGAGWDGEEAFVGKHPVPGTRLHVVRTMRAAPVLREARTALVWEYAALAGVFVFGVFGIFLARRQGRTREARERSRYHAIFEHSVDGVLFRNEDGVIEAVNRPLAGMLGYEPDEMVGMPVDSLHAPREPPFRLFLDADNERVLPLVERRFLRKDGSIIWVEVNAALVGGTRGEPRRVQCVVRDVTPHKRAEVSLRASEARWQSIAEKPFELVCVLDADHVVQMVTRVPKGCAASQLAGVSVYDLINPAQHDAVRELLTEVFATGESAYYEAQSRGTDRWYAHAVGAIAGGGGTEAVTVLSWDVTELHAARAEIGRTRDHYRAMLAAFPLMIWQSEPGGTRTYFNGTWLEFVGRPLADELGHGWAANVHPDDLDRYMTVHRGGLATRKPYEVDYRIRDRDNRFRVLHESGRPFLDHDGVFAGFIGVAQDVSHRLAAEQERRASESRLLEAERVGGLGTWTWDITTNEAWWSPENYRILGYDPGTTPASFEAFLNAVHQDDRATLRDVLDRALRGETRFRLDHRVQWADGTVVYVQELGEVVRGEDGTPVRMTGTLQDISQRKLAEDAVRDLNTSLENRVQRRTRELRLVNEELESFAYSVSHDLKAPLRAIKGFSGMLAVDHADSLPPEGRRLLGGIRGATTAMGRLIDELLAFSRIARVDIRMSAVDMTALVSDVLRDVDCDGVEVRTGDLPPAVGDPVLLRQVWANLIENAVKFSRPKRHPVIEISARQDPEETVYRVRDNGVGFPGERREEVFGVFQRLHADTEFEGTGVGLATVQRIVTRHGGNVWADGKIGGGAMVTFSLPHRILPDEH